MQQKKVGWIVYAALLLTAAFTLGWFVGNSDTGAPIQVVIAETAPQPVAKTENLTAPAVQTQERPAGPLDLNAAVQSDLETLPGIGPELASRIIAYRETIGAFVSKEQIMDVEGIGEKRFADLEQLITVGGTP